MIKRFGLIIGACLVLATAGAQAGELAPGLADHMAGLDDGDVIKVLVVMKDQPDIATLDADLRASRASLAERHAAVLGTLQRTARASQQPILQALTTDKALGGIEGWTPHWIINAVVVKGTVAAIRNLADRPDVEIVEPDLVPVPIEPVVVKAATPPAAKGRAGFVSAGVKVVGADRVWHELGITGEGTLVANIDSGVDRSHPALSGRWRGNFVAAATAWNDAGGTGSTVPVDPVGHGSHVMGTITGATAFDTVGVAPGAQWIASNAVYGGDGIDNQVIAGFEWMADPDGDPATTDDVPDVCHNSWGVNADFGVPDCYSYWWSVIDNCEAAGVVVTFSAGNEGPGPGTLRSPGNRADSPTNCFTVGSTASNPPYTVSIFSSRGPSQCGGPYAIKPEVMAPGENVYSCFPGGGYGYMDGTSMAGPHVAGVVALMRQAAPNLDVTTIKEVLMATAIDLGVAGEDNNYGHGMIDAYAAVSAVLGNVGTVTGTVTAAGTGQALAGAVVRDLRGITQTVSKADGTFAFTILGGTTTLGVSLFGYETRELPIAIPGGGSLEVPVALTAMPPASVSGIVRGPGGVPVAGATITALGTPVAPATSDGAGFYTLVLPAGEDAHYELMAMAPDLAYELRVVGLQGPRTVDFGLPEIQADGFESGGFDTFPWQRTGGALWSVSGDQAHEGVLSARTGAITHGGTTELSVDFYVQGDGEFSFWYRVDSEITYDRLRFYLDGQLEETWSGNIGWTRWATTVASGPHTFRWVYSKDTSVSVGADAAWIDLVHFPGTGVQPLAALVLDSTALAITLDAGTTGSLPLVLGNAGREVLGYRATAAAAAKDAPTWLTVAPDTGVVYPGSIKAVTVGFDAGRAGAGVHTGRVLLATNDPDHPDTAVTVTLTIAPVSGVAGDLPRQPDLQGAVPNPFNPATALRFSLPGESAVSLCIYDVSGRLVRTLVDRRLPAGTHSERWNGSDDTGRAVASGIYFARLQADGTTSIKPMTLVR
jgi:subtilisin family serine protease